MSDRMSRSNSSEISATLLASSEAISKKITEQRQAALKDIFIQYDITEEKLLEYARYDIAYLANAIADQKTLILTDYVEWLKELFQSNAIPLSALRKNIEIMREALLSALQPETHGLLTQYLQAALDILDQPVQRHSSHMDPASRYVSLAEQYLAAILAGNRPAAVALIMDAFGGGITIEDIYLHILEPVQNELGRLWLEKRITVGQEHFASGVTQLVMSQLYYPHICQSVKTQGAVIACCAPGELHEIGARMFADLCELRGWQVIFMGANISFYRFADYLIDHRARAIGISAAMPTSVAKVAALIQKIKKAKAAAAKIIVGGYAFKQSPELWRRVGADYYAENAQSALVFMEKLSKKT